MTMAGTLMCDSSVLWIDALSLGTPCPFGAKRASGECSYSTLSGGGPILYENFRRSDERTLDGNLDPSVPAGPVRQSEWRWPSVYPRARSLSAQPRQHAGYDTIAALAGEAEHVDRRHIHVARQRLAQQCACPEQACPDRRGGDRKTLGGFLHRHVLDLAHDEYRTERSRQLVDSALERTTDFGAQRGAGWRFASFIGHVGLRLVCFGRASIPKWHHNAFPLVLAQAHECLIDDDAGKPCRKPCAATEVADVAIGVEIGILERFFCFGVVLENRPGDTEQLAVVTPHQNFESSLIVARNTPNELGVVDFGGRSRHACRGGGLSGHQGLGDRSRIGWLQPSARSRPRSTTRTDG